MGGREGDTAAVARVLAHPMRLRILHEYRRDATSPSRIARRLGLPLHVVAYHTNALKQLGCIEQIRIERRRGVIERFHHAVAAPPIGRPGWERVPLKIRRRLLRAALALLAEDAARATDAGGFDGAAATRSPAWRRPAPPAAALRRRASWRSSASRTARQHAEPGDPSPVVQGVRALRHKSVVCRRHASLGKGTG